MQASGDELRKKAKEINDMIWGPDRKATRGSVSALKEQLDQSAKFALQKTLSNAWVSPPEKASLIAVLKEQPDAINLFIVDEKTQGKSVEMLKPIFGYKSTKIIESFRETFNLLQQAINEDRETLSGA